MFLHYIAPDFQDQSGYSKKLKLLQLGRMGEFGYFQKGFQDVIQGLFYLEENYTREELIGIEYTIIGDRPLLSEVLSKLEGLEKIKFRHFKKLPNDKVQEEIYKTNVVLMPSRFEGMSMFATEVLSKGKPFIYTDDGGMMDMIKDGYNGYAVRPFDYIGIAEAIMKFRNNPEKINEFSRNSAELFNREFSYEKVDQKFGVLLKDLKN